MASSHCVESPFPTVHEGRTAGQVVENGRRRVSSDKRPFRCEFLNPSGGRGIEGHYHPITWLAKSITEHRLWSPPWLLELPSVPCSYETFKFTCWKDVMPMGHHHLRCWMVDVYTGVEVHSLTILNGTCSAQVNSCGTSLCILRVFYELDRLERRLLADNSLGLVWSREKSLRNRVREWIRSKCQLSCLDDIISYASIVRRAFALLRDCSDDVCSSRLSCLQGW